VDSEPVLLVVDDEPDFLTLYRRLLGRGGVRVVTAASLAEALAALAAQRFHAIVTDLRLPDGNGLDLVRAATADGRYTPSIVVSGVADEQVRDAALAAGAFAFFGKPFESAVLAARVRDAVRG
jgi:two-component system response regulator PilR (NtrC family)